MKLLLGRLILGFSAVFAASSAPAWAQAPAASELLNAPQKPPSPAAEVPSPPVPAIADSAVPGSTAPPGSSGPVAPRTRSHRELPLRASVLTMGPGDHPFARFGHNALLLEWARGRRGVVYNFGTFAFDGLEGVRDFMAGRFRYWLSLSTLDRTQDFYASQNRTLVAQELDLTDDELARLTDALNLNALPEHRYYDYDYYYDNCSTRVRDHVDRVLGGVLKRSAQGPGRFSFREHTGRLTADTFPTYLGLDLALGPLTDKPTTRWEELFVPGELHDALANTKRERDGAMVPLVRRETVLLTADRPAVRSEPPSWAGYFALVGLAIGGAFAGLGQLGQSRKAARLAFALSSGLLGLVTGLLGTVFLVFWLFTKHWSAYRNENTLVCPPWALLLVVSCVGLAFGRERMSRLSLRVFQASAASSVLALLLALIPGFGQDNTRIAWLLGPVWLGLYVGVTRLLKLPIWPPAKLTPAR